jgi:hypothetical protein
MNRDVQTIANAWASLSEDVFVPHTEAEYNRVVAVLDLLIDEISEDETHPLACGACAGANCELSAKEKLRGNEKQRD